MNVDHAVALDDGKIYGNSFGLTAELDWDLNPEERAKVNLSKAKRLIKSRIKGSLGIDHKLWVVEDFNQSILEKFITDRDVVCDLGIVFPYIGDKVEWGRKPLREKIERLTNFALKTLERRLTVFLLHQLSMPEMKRQEPYVSLSIEHTAPNISAFESLRKESGHHETTSFYSHIFRYTHGLPNSFNESHHNMIHGHLASANLYLQSSAKKLGAENRFAKDCFEYVWRTLGIFYPEMPHYSVHFVNSDHIIYNYGASLPTESTRLFKVEAKSKTGDRYIYVADKSIFDSIIRLERLEATLENIVDRIFMPRIESYLKLLSFRGKVRFELTEGLSKSIVVEAKIQ